MDLRKLKKVLLGLVCFDVVTMVVLICLASEQNSDLFSYISMAIVVGSLVAAFILMEKYGRCPTCSHLLGREYFLRGANYCPNCGKRLP